MKKSPEIIDTRHLGGGLYAPYGEDLGIGRNPHGLVCVANEARFEASHFTESLTGYTVGWHDPEALDQVLERIDPSVRVSRKFEWKLAENADAFLSEVDDIREIGADFKRVEKRGTSQNDKTHNKGLTVRVDHDQVDELDTNFREAYVSWLMMRLTRSELRRAIALIDAASTNTARIFSDATNPDGLMRATLKSATDVSGVRPNTVVYGEAAWDLRLDAYEAPARENGGNHADWNAARLAQYLMVDHVEIMKARYQSSASAKTAVVPSVIYSYLALPGVMKDDPTNVKRFFSIARGGGRWGVYMQEFPKYTEISVEHYSKSVITSTLGMRKETVTAS